MKIKIEEGVIDEQHFLSRLSTILLPQSLPRVSLCPLPANKIFILPDKAIIHAAIECTIMEADGVADYFRKLILPGVKILLQVIESGNPHAVVRCEVRLSIKRQAGGWCDVHFDLSHDFSVFFTEHLANTYDWRGLIDRLGPDGSAWLEWQKKRNLLKERILNDSLHPGNL